MPPTVASTDPLSSATGISTAKAITINFSESVDITTGAFTVECLTGMPVGFTSSPVLPTTGGTSSVIATPVWPGSTTCTVTVLATKITDRGSNAYHLDGNGDKTPGDDYVFTFTTGAGDTAPSVTLPTTPTSGATSVAVGTTIVINFSEAVNLTSTAVRLECPVGTTKTFSGLSANNVTSVTLAPGAMLPYNTTCMVTVVAAQVSDLDGVAPVNMAADDSWTFTTMADPCPNTGLTLISDIQGSGITSPYVNSSFTVQGIVVGDYETGGMMGYFVQEEDLDADADLATSEGIFVYDANATSEVSLGDKVRVTGTVAELSGTDSGTGATLLLTELKTITSLIVCSSDQGGLVKTASVSLPVTDLTDLERYEGMRVTFPQPLTVTDNYDLDWYGQLTLSANGALAVHAPEHARRLGLREPPERHRAAQHRPRRRQHDDAPGPHYLPRYGPDHAQHRARWTTPWPTSPGCSISATASTGSSRSARSPSRPTTRGHDPAGGWRQRPGGQLQHVELLRHHRRRLHVRPRRHPGLPRREQRGRSSRGSEKLVAQSAPWTPTCWA